MSNPLFFKIIVVGDTSVGKTSLLQRYCYDMDPSSESDSLKQSVTIGSDFDLKVIQNFEGKYLRLQLWDIAGQDRSQIVTKALTRDAMGCIVVCDSNREQTLKNAVKWKESIDEHSEKIMDQTPPCLLLQNKSDLLPLGKPEYFQEQRYLDKLALENGFFKAMQVSAKTNSNIEDAMVHLLRRVITRHQLKSVSEEKKLSKYDSVADSLKRSEAESVMLDNSESRKPKGPAKGCC